LRLTRVNLSFTLLPRARENKHLSSARPHGAVAERVRHPPGKRVRVSPRGESSILSCASASKRRAGNGPPLIARHLCRLATPVIHDGLARLGAVPTVAAKSLLVKERAHRLSLNGQGRQADDAQTAVLPTLACPGLDAVPNDGHDGWTLEPSGARDRVARLASRGP